jgi:hypothetical protein
VGFEFEFWVGWWGDVAELVGAEGERLGGVGFWNFWFFGVTGARLFERVIGVFSGDFALASAGGPRQFKGFVLIKFFH